MKKFKEFKSEQQYIAEVGPIGAVMMGAAGLFGGWLAFKKLKKTIKGYRESSAEKQENKKEGFSIRIKKFNPETGKEESEIVDIPPGDRRGNVDADGILALEKEEQKAQNSQNKRDASDWKKARDKLGLNDKEYVDHKAKEKKDKARADSGDVKTPADEISLTYKEFQRVKKDDAGKPIEDAPAALVTVTKDKAPKDMFDDEIGEYQDDKTTSAEKKFNDYKKAHPDADAEDETEDTPEDVGPPDGPPSDKEKEDAKAAGEKWVNKGDDEKPKWVKEKDEGTPADGKGEVEDPKAATDIYLDKGKAPDGWEWQRDDEGGKVPNFDNKNKMGQILTKDDAKAFRDEKSAEKERERKAGEGEAGSGVKTTATKGMSTLDKMKAGQAAKKEKRKKKTTTGTTSAPQGGGLGALAKKQGLSTQRVLKFGEFIAEDLMKDLKLASKSRKDSEITLDDGTEIPMDAFTAEILVKYIEGLSSSEKKKTIKQFQRTERAFMKVLGKAHEG